MGPGTHLALTLTHCAGTPGLIITTQDYAAKEWTYNSTSVTGSGQFFVRATDGNGLAIKTMTEKVRAANRTKFFSPEPGMQGMVAYITARTWE